jgi:predicted CXXCH cytochrome family protein
MKKSLLVSFAIGMLLSFSAVAMAADSPGMGIKATSHDLSALGNKSVSFGDATEQLGQDRICIYCHAPHNTMPAGGANTYVPLWNHAMTVQTFIPYSNGADEPLSVQHASQAELFGNQPGSVSMLCLSCHDGTVATNQYGFVAGTSQGMGDKYITSGRGLIGGGTGDLSNHHPIGFDYQSVIDTGDNEINPTTTTVAAQPTGPATIADLLWNGNVECVSCHDVHNTKNAGLKFTWVDDTQSALCLTCHKKN